ncbi:unnamed protein product, partial [Mesorhabditis belari]|uniref:PAS domain-containing protein n=1 Tax=Mesorhabditis belari TaxID=2138241 RepID=A0AAF3EEQ2_9BILA
MAETRSQLLKSIDELRPLLPVSDAILEQHDRTTILRLTCAYLNLLKFKSTHMPMPNPYESYPTDFETMMLQSLEGFCVILDAQFRILYTTEGVSTHLGFSQHQMLGQFLHEFLHPDDFHYLQQSSTHPGDFPLSATPVIIEAAQIFTLRMNAKLPKRNAGFSQHGYKTAICTGFFRDFHWAGCSQKDVLMINFQLIDKSGTDVLLGREMFFIRCTPELRIIFIEGRAGILLGYNPANLLNKTMYEMVIPDDVECIVRAHMRLIRLHEYQSVTVMVRLLKQGGDLIYVTLHLCKIPALNSDAISPYSIGLIVTVFGTERCQIQSFLQDCPAYTLTSTGEQSIGYYSNVYYRGKQCGQKDDAPMPKKKKKMG